MPPNTDYQLALTKAQRDVLEQVCQEQGLETIDQAAEWLAKTALRKAARKSNGRGRALYPVPQQEKTHADR